MCEIRCRIGCYREVPKTSARPTSLRKISRTRRRLLTCLHFSYAVHGARTCACIFARRALVESTYGSLARSASYTRTLHITRPGTDVYSVVPSATRRRGETPIRRVCHSLRSQPAGEGKSARDEEKKGASGRRARMSVENGPAMIDTTSREE